MLNSPAISIFIFFVCMLPCVLQILVNWLEYRRTGIRSKLWFGVTGFTMICVSFVCIFILLGVKPEFPRENLRFAYRAFLVAGCIFWMVDQLIWLYNRIELVSHDS